MSILQKTISSIKQTRPFMMAIDLPYWKQVKKAYTRYLKQYKVQKSLWQGVSYNTIKKHDTENIPWLDKHTSVEEVKAHPDFASFSPAIQEQILQWQTNGYLILKNFFDTKAVNELEQSIEGCLSPEEIAEYKTSRLQDLWSKNMQVDAFYRSPELIKVLSFILGRAVKPFQTLSFYKGSQQAAHSDSIHFTTEPFGYLIAVWIALEDVKEGSGELMYYPGSHKLPFVTNLDYDHGNSWWRINKLHYARYENKMREVVKATGLAPQTFLPKKGDVLVWHANLLHGGSKILDSSLTRKSLVIHYYGENVLCYHERIERLAVLTRLKKKFTC